MASALAVQYLETHEIAFVTRVLLFTSNGSFVIVNDPVLRTYENSI